MPQSKSASRFPSVARVLRLRREAIATHPRRYILTLVALLAILLAVDAVVAWPYLAARLQAIAVLDRVANEPVPAVVRWMVSDSVTTTDMTLPLPSGAIEARMYTPVNHPNAPALVIVHGVHYLGMNEPRLVAFASAMASCGLRVLTPELPDIKDYHVGAGSIASIGDTAVWMDQHNGGRPVGVMGLSFSGSLALLAAAEPQYKPDMQFVVAVGSEDSMARVANYYLTGRDVRPNGTTEVLPPHEYGALVLEYENLQDFVPVGDLEAVRLVLRDHLYEDPAAEHAAMAKLTQEQAAESKQLMDTTSPITRQMIAESDAKHVAAMAGVSPEGHMARLATPVYLLQGEADNIIPAAETLWLERQIPHGEVKAALISPVISHLDMEDKGPTFGDRWRLARFFAMVLHAAETR
ncbi:MAG: CocE/NonD family hydrolase [Acidobacteriaceae bacterium]